MKTQKQAAANVNNQDIIIGDAWSQRRARVAASTAVATVDARGREVITGHRVTGPTTVRVSGSKHDSKTFVLQSNEDGSAHSTGTIVGFIGAQSDAMVKLDRTNRVVTGDEETNLHALMEDREHIARENGEYGDEDDADAEREFNRIQSERELARLAFEAAEALRLDALRIKLAPIVSGVVTV